MAVGNGRVLSPRSGGGTGQWRKGAAAAESGFEPGGNPLPPKGEDGKWDPWILSLSSKDRNIAIRNHGLDSNDCIDLKLATTRFKHSEAQKRHHRKKAGSLQNDPVAKAKAREQHAKAQQRYYKKKMAAQLQRGLDGQLGGAASASTTTPKDSKPGSKKAAKPRTQHRTQHRPAPSDSDGLQAAEAGTDMSAILNAVLGGALGNPILSLIHI